MEDSDPFTMNILLSTAAFWIAAVLAGVMGYAIQRGATCTVAAVDEFVTRRRAHRLVSMVEASLWVCGGLLIAQLLHRLPTMPAGYALNAYTVLGGILLGVGAYINGACVFGAIARLGSGEWAYIATPLGFYVGCLTVASLFASPVPARLEHGSPMLQATPGVVVLFAGFMFFRILTPLLSEGDGANRTVAQRVLATVTRRVWSPHSATAVIGITFLFILLLVGGTWAYTDALAELAQGMADSLVARAALLAALFAGAFLGGHTAGRFRSAPLRLARLAKCFAGGALMAWGSLLIPGSNDGLILVGMPLLRPYAWVAFLTMCVSIAAAMLLQKALRAGPQKAGMPNG